MNSKLTKNARKNGENQYNENPYSGPKIRNAYLRTLLPNIFALIDNSFNVSVARSNELYFANGVSVRNADNLPGVDTNHSSERIALGTPSIVFLNSDPSPDCI